MRPSRVGSLAVLLILAFSVGQCTANSDMAPASPSLPPPEPTPVETIIKTVTEKQIEKVEIKTLSKQCRDVINLTKKIGETVVPLINSSGKSLDIMSDAHQAITASDGAALNDLRTRMYQLDGEQSKSTLDLTVYLMPSFRSNLEACERSIE